MHKNFSIEQYKEKYFDDLKISYQNVFRRNFLSKENYKRRFKYNGKYTSFLLINNDNKTIQGHIGFKVSNSNLKIKGKIAFRYSTFISLEYRGLGVYKYFMDQTKELLLQKFEVHFIFAWPNTNNLISCLRDEDYLNQYPIITWQHYLGNADYIYRYYSDYIFEDLCKNNKKFKLLADENRLTIETFEDLKEILFDRDNKKYKIIYKENDFAFIGESIFDNRIYLSIVLIQGINLDLIISILNHFYKQQNVVIQIWCNPKDRILQKNLLKSKFIPNGPVFYNGIYELTNNKFVSQEFFPSMYNHDAF